MNKDYINSSGGRNFLNSTQIHLIMIEFYQNHNCIKYIF